jgi:hypothetical protein
MHRLADQMDSLRQAIDDEMTKTSERIADEMEAINAGKDYSRSLELENIMIELRLLSRSIDGMLTTAEDRALAIIGRWVDLRLRIGGDGSDAPILK